MKFSKRAFGAVTALSCIVACSSAPVTELVAGVSTQVQVPKELRSVEVSVKAGGQTSYCQHFEVVQGKVQLPRTLGVNKEHDNIPVTISIIGYTDEAADLDNDRSDCPDDPTILSTFAPDESRKFTPRVVRRSIQTYRQDHIAFVPMPLRFSCFDQICTDPTKTCKAGACADAQIDADSLADYNDDLVYGNTNTCFSSLRCLASAQPPTLIDATNCLYSATGPAGPDPGDLNVRVIYDGFVSEVLDDDRDEGFFVPDASKPEQFQLAPGLCHPMGSNPHNIISIAASRACPTKTALQPPCDEGAQVLIPAPSALYLMLDRSSSMQPLLTEPQGVSQVLNLTLTDASLATTGVGFKFIPSIASACTPASYATLQGTGSEATDLKFEPATKAQADIALRIVAQQTGTFPASAPPFPEVLDATSGAYKAVQSVNDAPSYNRRAVILITNNDVNDAAGCSGSQASATSAAAALASTTAPTYTYVILLKNPSDPNAAQTLANATALATAGGTTVFNATGDDAGPAALNAINSVIADLSSCLYETPTNITDQTAKVAINSPLGTQDVPFNSGCSPTGTTNDGWNFDGDKIRICGASCNTIRSVLTNTANGANATAQSAPQVVVTAAQAE
ncbi:MAG TPA: hypothetical protein VF407_15415 [Polyangiaceae bacterium]